MKSKKLIVTTIIFFLTVNTTYYWEGKIGIFLIPVLLILIVMYLGLVLLLLTQISILISENFTNKSRLINVILLALVLTLTFFYPLGLFDFDKLEGENILIAEREGSANCMITLKLKDNFTFKSRSVCFGVTETKGEYHLQNDTIYFDNTNLQSHGNEFYAFAVIEPSKFGKDGENFNLQCYSDLTDTVGFELQIIKNEINSMKNKKTGE